MNSLAMSKQRYGMSKSTCRLPGFTQQGAKLSPTERNELYAEMEQQLLEIFVELSKEGLVAVVDNLTISPCAEAIDHHGAVAMEARAEIETIF